MPTSPGQRVEFAWGNRGAVDHGFMSIFDMSDFDPATLARFYPVKIDLDHFMRWTWRIQEFEGRGNMHLHTPDDFNLPLGPPDFTPGFKITRTDNGGVPVDNERRIELFQVALAPFGYGGFRGQRNTGFFEPLAGILRNAEGQFSIIANNVVQPVAYDFGASMHMPPLEFTYQYQLDRFITTDQNAFTGLVLMDQNLMIDGVPVPLYWNTPSYTVVSNTWAFVATKYYAYRNSMDLPVYNTTTGIQLVDPFS